jgi:hypothetical protein
LGTQTLTYEISSITVVLLEGYDMLPPELNSITLKRKTASSSGTSEENMLHKCQEQLKTYMNRGYFRRTNSTR